MASTSEQSFAQRYTKARQLVEYLTMQPAYAPGNSELEVNEISELLNGIETANSDVASKLSAVQTERDERFELVKGDTGVIKRAMQIRDYIASILPKGKKERDYVKAQKIVQKLRGQRLTKKPVAIAGAPIPKTVSTIEVSFGSLLGAGRELLEVIKTVPGYTPSNTALTVANLTTFLNSIDAKNTSVAQKYEEYDDSVEARSGLYSQLQDRLTKTKLALAAQFGKDSNVYKDAVAYM